MISAGMLTTSLDASCVNASNKTGPCARLKAHMQSKAPIGDYFFMGLFYCASIHMTTANMCGRRLMCLICAARNSSVDTPAICISCTQIAKTDHGEQPLNNVRNKDLTCFLYTIFVSQPLGWREIVLHSNACAIMETIYKFWPNVANKQDVIRMMRIPNSPLHAYMKMYLRSTSDEEDCAHVMHALINDTGYVPITGKHSFTDSEKVPEWFIISSSMNLLQAILHTEEDHQDKKGVIMFSPMHSPASGNNMRKFKAAKFMSGLKVKTQAATAAQVPIVGECSRVHPTVVEYLKSSELMDHETSKEAQFAAQYLRYVLERRAEEPLILPGPSAFSMINSPCHDPIEEQTRPNFPSVKKMRKALRVFRDALDGIEKATHVKIDHEWDFTKICGLVEHIIEERNELRRKEQIISEESQERRRLEDMKSKKRQKSEAEHRRRAYESFQEESSHMQLNRSH